MLSAFLLNTDINLIKLFIGILFSLELFFNENTYADLRLGKNLGTYLSGYELQSRSNLLISAILCHELLGKKNCSDTWRIIIFPHLK